MEFEQKRREVLKQLAAAAGTAALGRAAPVFAQQDTLKIACIWPLSGPLGLNGNAYLTGAKIAAEQFNRAGGVLGRKIEIVARDDKASPAESALVGRDVLGSGIKFIVGGLLTAPAMAIVNLLAENNALLLLTGSQIMSITHENFSANAFRAHVNGRMSLFATAQAMAEAYPNVTRWGGVTPDNQFGTDNYRIFSVALKKAYKEKAKKDIQTLDPVLTPFPATDFKVQIARLMGSPLEGLYTGMVGADYYTFMQQAKQQGLYNKVKVFAEAGSGTSLVKGLGANNLPKDLWTPTVWYPRAKDANAVSKALLKDYAEMTGDKGIPDSGIYNGHTGMLALLNAIKNAKSLEPAVVRVALERVEFETATGPFRFRREDHQAIENVLVLKIEQKPGDPGWDVTKIITVKGEDVVESASPGQKYAE